MELEIKNLRLQIDRLGQLTKSLEGSAELTKCHNGLLLGKAWLGKCLGAIGTDSPYPKDGERHSIADIEKTADVAYTVDMMDAAEDWQDKNHIEKVDWLRQQISEIIKQGTEDIEQSPEREGFRDLPLMWYYLESKKQLMMARFWLGFELERIRENA